VFSLQQNYRIGQNRFCLEARENHFFFPFLSEIEKNVFVYIQYVFSHFHLISRSRFLSKTCSIKVKTF
jgi:hypothetical protein